MSFPCASVCRSGCTWRCAACVPVLPGNCGFFVARRVRTLNGCLPTQPRPSLPSLSKHASGSRPLCDTAVPEGPLRYRWHNSRWWYWTPEEKWVVWTGTTWVPFGESGGESEAHAAASLSRHVTSNGSREGDDSTALAQPTYRIRGSWGGSGALRVSDYALYGWSWGPGTAYRDGPPRRF